VARSIIDAQRDLDPQYVFTYCPRSRKGKPGEPQATMITKAWSRARSRAADKWEKMTGDRAPEGFRTVRVHDLKHSFGRRLRAAGVSFEDQQDLLGHKSTRITTHYSAAEIANLIAAYEKALGEIAPSHRPPVLRGAKCRKGLSTSRTYLVPAEGLELRRPRARKRCRSSSTASG
jgi:integrase